MKKIKNSPQYTDEKFKNKSDWVQPSILGNLGIMWKFLFGGDDRTPDYELPSIKTNLTEFNRKEKNILNSTWLGHSTLLINIDGYKIITDPVFEKSVSFFGPSRYNGDVPIDINAITEVDVIIISHNHYDHLNKYSVQNLNGKTKRFIVPLGVGAQLIKWGVPVEKITELDWWENVSVTEDLVITATPTQHFSGRGLTDRDATLWASFVIQSQQHKIFFSGDSGYFPGFKEIGSKYGPFDMTFLECGAYNENWHHIHMFPEETVMAHNDLKGNILHPIHWGTFNLSLHPWYEPMMRLKKAAAKNNITVSTPAVGGTTVFNTNICTTEWWKPSIEIKTEKTKKNIKLGEYNYDTGKMGY